MPKGKPYSAEFKAKVTLEALQGARTVSEIAAEHDLNPNLVRNWKAKAEGWSHSDFPEIEWEKIIGLRHIINASWRRSCRPPRARPKDSDLKAGSDRPYSVMECITCHTSD